MRPQGDTRKTIVDAVKAQRAELRDVVRLTGVDYDKARQVLSDCVRAGELTYKLEARPHARRSVAVYEPVIELDDLADGACWHELANCVAAWR